MDNQTFFTLILGSGFALGSGVAIYAMSIACIEPRLAKRAASVAWLCGTILCIWYGGTNDMPKAYRYSVAFLLSGILTLFLCSALDYIKERENLTSIKTSNPELDHVKRTPLNMWQVFDTDFPGIGRTMMSNDVSISESSPQDLQFASYWDLSSNSYYLAFYFHARVNNYTLVYLTANFVSQSLQILNQIQFVITTPGQTKQTSLLKMNFSKQVYLYVDDILSPSQIVDLEQAYSISGYDVDVRDYTYLMLHKNDRNRTVTSDGPVFKMGEAKIRLPEGVDGMRVEFKNVPMTTPLEPIINHLVPKHSSPTPQPLPLEK